MIPAKKVGQRVFSNSMGAFAPLFELLAFSEGQYVPAKRVKSVRVFARKGVQKPRLLRVV